ncbi:DUF6386 family protein [Janthinobacterium sp. RB2R34]|uniref:DUF6386 family protein n=1 Tax=Janthinobacterium sp. RB2R34 TaxID=3424193 RepID=UPI003F219C73
MVSETGIQAAQTCTFVTDTATMCVFDVAGLCHRLEDDVDWWSIPSAELAEVNAGHVAFLNLGSDGAYAVELVDELANPQVTVNLAVGSGRVFIGAAEEVTADGLEPEAVFGGMFVQLAPGKYRLLARRNDAHITLALLPGDTDDNSFADLLRI